MSWAQAHQNLINGYQRGKLEQDLDEALANNEAWRRHCEDLTGRLKDALAQRDAYKAVVEKTAPATISTEDLNRMAREEYEARRPR